MGIGLIAEPVGIGPAGRDTDRGGIGGCAGEDIGARGRGGGRDHRHCSRQGGQSVHDGPPAGVSRRRRGDPSGHARDRQAGGGETARDQIGDAARAQLAEVRVVVDRVLIAGQPLTLGVMEVIALRPVPAQRVDPAFGQRGKVDQRHLGFVRDALGGGGIGGEARDDMAVP
jgi:hypothetical protein